MKRTTHFITHYIQRHKLITIPVSILLLAALGVVLVSLFAKYQKEQQHQEMLNNITHFITTTKPATKPLAKVERTTISQGAYTVSLAKQSNTTDPVKFAKGNSSIAFTSFANPTLGDVNATTAIHKNNKTIYQNIYNGIDLIYTDTPNKLLEEYEVKVQRPLTEFIQQIDLSGVTYQKQTDGSILFFDKATGKLDFATPKPVMYEAVNDSHRSYGLHYEIGVIHGQTYLIKVIDQAGQEWLKHASYPVMVDATVTLTLSGYETYPVLNNQFQVRIDTVGTGDLGITAISKGLSFVGLTCANQSVTMNDQLVAQNFSCSDSAIATFKVTDPGQQSFAFTYAGQTTVVTTQGSAGRPVFLSASVDKPVVSVGQTITVTAQIADDTPLSSVSADMGGVETIQLNKTSGTNQNGTWQASWKVHDTKPTSYPITFSATDANNQTTTNSIAFFDPIDCSAGGDHAGADWDPATACTSGDFSGVHTNIGTFSIANGETANVKQWSAGSYGTATVSATTVTISGTLNGDGRGYTGGSNFVNGSGPGGSTQTNNPAGGAGYGGAGGTATTAGGSVYGSYLQPVDPGSGGGSGGCCQAGSNGGGAIKITATGTVTVTGTITMNGLTTGGSRGGGGSGGSIWITAGTFAGSGTITANGGASSGGGGGGGRIAIYYSTSNTFSGSAPTVTAGTGSAAGETGTSILVDTTNNDLYLQTSQTWTALPVTSGGEGSGTISYHNISVSGSSTINLKGYNTTNSNGVGITYYASNNFTVGSGSTLNMNSYGYAGGGAFTVGSGPGGGTGANNPAGGGGYGGTGGNDSGGNGATYGSATAPVDLGSGGGSGGCCANGLNGGGATKITALNTLSVSGSITANGGSDGSGRNGAGSGGSIWLLTGTLTGSGVITADGGTSVSGGGGGGGRIAVYYTTANSWTGTTLTAASAASGGTGGAGAGSNGTVTVLQKYVPTITFNQYQSDCSTSVASGANVTSTTVCLGVTTSDGDNPDTETIDIELEPNGSSFTNTPSYTFTNVAMAGSPVSQTHTFGVSFGTSYHWQVRITDSYGFTTGWTARGSSPDFQAQVPTPLTLTPTYNNDNSIGLSWTTDGTVVDGYDVEVSVDGGSYNAVNSNVAYPATSYTDTTTPTANHQYTYRIRAFVGVNNSTYTTASNVYTTPAAPTSVSLSQSHAATILVSWTNNSPYASNFEVQRQIDGGSWATITTTVAGNATSYSDTAVRQPGSVYNYKVRATRSSPDSLQSSFAVAGATLTPTIGFGKGIYLTAAGRLVVQNDVKGSVDVFKNIQNDTTDRVGQDVAYDSSNPTNGPTFPPATTINDLTVKEGVSAVDGKSDVIYVGTNNGLFAIHENATTPSSGAIKVYTNNYISDLMVGDTRGMWPLDNGFGSGLSDASSHTQTLTNNSSTTFTASGVRGNAASFNGTSQYLSIADNANLSVTGSLTFGAWFKPTATGSAQVIMAKHGSYSLSLTSSGTIQGQVIGATTATRTGATILDTNWHRATVVYNATAQTLDVYIDGKLDNAGLSGTIPASLTDSAGDFEIGGDNGSTLFGGNIDEPFVTSTVMTPGEIAYSYLTGYRALQNHTSSRITGITGSDNYQQLLGGGTNGATVNTVKAVRVDAGNQFIYAGTNDNSTNTGGVSVIGVASDSVADLYATANTNKKDSLGTGYAANDIVAISLAGTPNPAYNGQTDASGTLGIISILGTNDTATRDWMETQRYSLTQVLGATTGLGGSNNQINVNNLFTVGNALSPATSSTGEAQFIPSFQIRQDGTVIQNYQGTDTSGTVISFNDTVSTSGATFALTGSALTTGTLFSATANNLTTGTAILTAANSLTTGTLFSGTVNSLTTGSALNLSSTSTSFTGNLVNLSTAGNGKVINISSTSNAAGTNYGLYSSLTGAATTNVAGYFSATGGTNNYGLVVPNGRIGFGTTTPTALLDVAGNASSSGAITFRGAAGAFNALNGDAFNFLTSISGDGGLTSRFYIANNGNVGIGTTNPAALLDINSLFDVLSTGKIGIGTTSPLATLDIRGNSNNTPAASISGALGKAALVVDNSVGDIFTASSSGVTRVTITQSGNLEIGTNPSPLAKLTIGGAPAGTGTNAMSTSFFTNAGALGTTGGNELVLGSFGFTSSNNSALGIHGYRNSNGSDWQTASIGLGIDVDNTTRVNSSSFWINPNGTFSFGSSPSTNATLDFGASAATNKIYLYDSGTAKYGFGANAGALQLYAGADSVNNLISFNRYDGTTLTEMARIQSGTLAIGSNSFLANAGLDIEKNGLGNATLVINQLGAGDILTASSSGATKFTISNSGNMTTSGNITGANFTASGTLGVSSYATVSASLAIGNLSAQAGIGNLSLSGNLGVGTNTPAEKLTVAGNLSLFNAATGRADIVAGGSLDKTWNTSALFNSAGTSFSGGMQNPAVSNRININPNFGLSNWTYRKAITIDNTGNSNTLTNYQASMSANTSTLIAAGKMNSDCSDIRVTDTDGSTTLPYWIESGCNTSSTVIWTKIPSITASSTKTIYLYYGNPNGTSQSSASNTFIRDVSNLALAYRFDESSGTTTTDYSGNSNTGTYTGSSVISGQFYNARNFSGSSDRVSLTSAVSVATSWSVSAWINFPLPVTGGGWRSVFNHSNSVFHHVIFDSSANLGVYNNAFTSSGYNAGGLSGWHNLIAVGTGGSTSFYIDGTVVGTASAQVQNQGIDEIGNYNGADEHTGKIDEPRIYTAALTQAQITDLAANYGYATSNDAGHELVRKFSAPEPATSVGSEATSYTSGVQTWTSDTLDAGSGNTYMPNFLTVSYTDDGSDNIHPKFQILGSSTGSFSGEEIVYPNGGSSYYQNGTAYSISSGTQLDVSSTVTQHFRYWKVKVYMDTGATTTDTPTVTSIRLQDYHGLSMLASGYLGIGTTAPTARLDVSDAQSSTVAAMIRNTNTSSTASGIGVQLGATSPGTSNSFLSFLDGAGEVIGKITGNGSGGVTYATTGIDFAEYYKKASSAGTLTAGTVVCTSPNGAITCNSTSNILGVVSDRAGFAGGTEHADDPNYVLVGLVGQLPVKVATDSAPILAGDPVTTNENGMAVKATTTGEIVGHALSSTDANGTVMVSVNPSWFDPGFYASATDSTNLTTARNMTANDATIEGTLTVLGRTTLTDLGVTGSITNGLLTIHGLTGEINTLAGNLELQSEGLGGVDILNGKVTIDTSGNMALKGSLKAQDITTDKLNITTDQNGSTGVLGTSAGTITIPLGQTTVTVSTNKLTPNSLIFVTPDIPVAVAARKVDAQTFQIILSEPIYADVHVNWWIIN